MIIVIIKYNNPFVDFDKLAIVTLKIVILWEFVCCYGRKKERKVPTVVKLMLLPSFVKQTIQLFSLSIFEQSIVAS